MDNSNIKSITSAGGNLRDSVGTSKIIDGDLNTYWETGKHTSSTFNNELIFTLEEATVLNRIAYRSAWNTVGFAEDFEVWASNTSKGDTFQLVSSAKASKTADVVEIKFNPTNFKRIKFVFKNTGTATASEMMFYKEDAIGDKAKTIFTNEQKNELSEEFNTIEEITEFEKKAESHPLYNSFKEDIENAKILLENNSVDYIDAKVSTFLSYSDERLSTYDDMFKVKRENITSITTNGGNYAENSIDRAIDGNQDTKWHSNKTNGDNFTNEIVITLDKLTTIDRITYLNKASRGFAKGFDIYASRTTIGDTFEKISSGKASITTDNLEIKFNPTELRRIKFVFKEGHENWALASEIGLYKEDTVKDKMERIFTNEQKNELSEEFDTEAKINEFEEQAKTHPLYENYKEDFENARVLLSTEKVESIEANVSRFDVYYSKYKNEYDEVYKMSNDNIQSVYTNGGYLNYYSTVANMTDGNLDTYWETGKHTTNDFKNEIIFTLKENTVLNRIAYRSASNTVGFAEEFEVWASNTTKGDTFQLVTSGTARKTSDMIEIKFNPTSFKRVKFVFKNSGKATASEIMFYKEDKVYDKVNNIFTNGLMNELTEDVNTLEKITALENELANYPLKEEYTSKIELAKEILENPTKYQEGILTAVQRGDSNKEAREHQIARTSYNLQTFGKYVTPGETIEVYVDADKNGVMPQLVFGQLADDKNGWSRFYNLQPGLNTITAPSFDNMSPAVIYLYNPALPSDQDYAPKVRVEGGTSFPVYYHGVTDPAEYEKELEEFTEKISVDDNDFADGLRNDVYYNVTELVSENNLITTSAAGALQGIKEMKSANKTVADTMNDWEKMWHEFQKFSGFVEGDEDPRNDIYNCIFISRVFTKGPTGWSDWGYTGYNGGNAPRRDTGTFKNIVKPFSMGDDWLYYHEWGHSINNSSTEHIEVTNNLYSAQMRRVLGTGGQSDWIDWDTLYTRFSGSKVEQGFWTSLGMISQPLYYYGTDTYGKASRIARTNPDGILDGLSNNQQRLVITYSLAVGYDLTDFFEGWGYCEATELMKSKVANLQKPDVKLEYMNTSGIDYEGEGFTEETNVNINSFIVNSESKEATITFSVDEKDKEDVMGYEIIRDGEVVGYTTNNSFTDKNIDGDEEYIYEVIAYAKDLTTSKSVKISSKTPSLLQDEKITIKLNEEFNPLNYVNVFDYLGNKIDDITVEGNVDTSTKGVYDLTYEVVSNGITVTKKSTVEVVSDYEYLSDREWVSATTDYGNIRKNNDLKLLVNGEVKSFDKGFGIHANGEIVYDLSDTDYDKFEAYIGVSRSIAEQNNSSITFSILADGTEVYNSGLMKYNTPAKYVSIDIKDVKELRIVIGDSGNGISSDHAVIGNPILTTNNVKPIISVEDKEYKIGTVIDFNDGVTATDIEDGDISSSVQIVSNTYEEGKLGRFEVVYGVTDSDNNYTEKKAYVTVYEDFEVKKSKYGQFNNLNGYNEQFKIPVVSISNNGGNWGTSVIGNAIDGNLNTHWETNRQNTISFQNEVILDLGETKEISRVAYAARRNESYKGFANKFEIYVSTEAEGDNFVLAGKGEYRGNSGDVVEFEISKTNARRVKFKFIEADRDWASLSEISLYTEDVLAEKIESLFTDSNKTEVSEDYNTLDKVDALDNEVKDHPAYELFEVELNRAREIIIAKLPKIELEETTFVKLNSEFNIMSGVTATDQEDGVITDRVLVNSEGFNINKTGEYTITYTVQDNDSNVSTKERKVVVYSDSKYLSDINWESARTDYGSVRKDKSSSNVNIKLLVDGEVKEFTKGIGTHANSEIIYDLEGSNYEYFETYVGVDRNIAEQNNSSVIFKIYADGEEVYNSGLMKYNTEAKLVRIPVSGVKELKLVANNGGNGNSSDHADFADAKFLITNSLPTIEVEEETFVEYKGEFDKYSTLTATDIEDGDIISKVVIDGEVNTNKAGVYKLTYTVTDSDNNIVTKERNVVVYSDTEYLSDINWESARTDYGSVRKDKSSSNVNIKLLVDGEVKEFTKGIGTHANSEIIYDLEGSNYEYFETYVGVDRNIAEQNNSSVIFKIYADGEEVYNSGLMKYNTEAKLVRIPVSGVKELKLVANNGGNGNSSDHADFADAKFLITNSRPELTIPESISTTLGQPIDINQEYSATDAEDGDITANVKVEGDVNFDKTGEYPITYTVTDSDGNTVTKTRTVAVVDMNDFTYLTDYEWKSETHSYAAPKKDVGNSSRAIRLTDENGKEVVYNRGLGAHSNSTVIYDLSDKNYDYFTSYVGVDRSAYNTIGSVTFEVYVDGVKKFDSRLMRSTDAKQYVKVDINGAKELKLVVTDGNNGNGYDHASWGDTKLHYANENGASINRAELDELIKTAEALDSKIYVEETFANLTVALEEAKAGLADGYTQEEVDTLYNNLKSAYDALIKSTDFSSLEEVIANNSGLNELHYYKDAFDAHKALVEQGKAILANENSTQEEIDEIVAKINESANKLVVREAKVELERKINEAKAIENNGYMDVRWDNFIWGIEYAEEIYKNVNSTDDEVRSAIFTLGYFKSELK